MAQRYDLHGPDSKTVLAGACCAFGVFDGVHEGHRYIIDQVVQAAMHDGRQSVIITFDIDPDELFAADRLKKLMTNEDRLDMLGSLGADAVFVLPFDRQLANQEPTEFLQSLFGQYVPASLHVGQDIRFGRRAQGAIDDLRSWGELHGMHVVGHQLLAEDGSAVTSTRIRRLLGDGEVQEAAKLLCRPYCLRGTVEGGRHEGRQFGFRTANLHVPDQLRAIGDGVYACYATSIKSGIRLRCRLALPPRSKMRPLPI